jgi:hypothetical protein
MVALKILQSPGSGLRHIGFPLIGNELGSRLFLEGFPNDPDHEFRVLAAIEGKGLPEFLPPGPRILYGDDLQWYVEELPGRGVCHGLDPWEGDSEVEAAIIPWGFLFPRRWRWII